MQNLIMNVRIASEVKLYKHDGSNDVAKFNVFYSRGRDKTPIFFSASVFGKKAHTAAQYFKKNMELTIRCELQPVTYMKKSENVEVQTFELIIYDFQMHGGTGISDTASKATPEKCEDEQEDEIIE